MGFTSAENTLYVLLGASGADEASPTRAETLSFSPVTREWVSLSAGLTGTKPTGRRDPGVAGVNGRVFVFGGDLGARACVSSSSVADATPSPSPTPPSGSRGCIPNPKPQNLTLDCVSPLLGRVGPHLNFGVAYTTTRVCQERLVFYCRKPSASTAPAHPGGYAALRIVLVTVPRVSRLYAKVYQLEAEVAALHPVVFWRNALERVGTGVKNLLTSSTLA